MRAVSVSLFQFLRLKGSWTPCALRTFGIFKGEPLQVCLVYYESCALNQVRRYQGIVGTAKRLQTWRSLLPRGPFCSHSNHQLTDIQALCTILWKCILCMVTSSKFLCKNRNQLIWLNPPLVEYFLVWCLYGKCRFCACGQLLSRASTCST